MKVTVVGAGGNVGSTVVDVLAQRDICKEIVAVDIEKKDGDKTFYPSKGRGLDQWESAPVHLFDTRIKGTVDYADTAGSDVCVITAGVPRRPGMSRDDLLEINANIVSGVSKELAKHSPDTIIIVVSNPLDVMVQVAKEASGLPYERVMGMAGILDTARYRAFIADELDVSPKDIQALLMGGHGDTMVPLPRFTTLSGMPITHFIDEDRLNEIVERAKKGGGEIVGLMGTSAWYAPGAAAAQMVEAILLDQNRIFPVCAHIDGQYGIDDLYIGVPVKLGTGGVKEVIEVDLNKKEHDLLEESAKAVRSTLDDFRKLMNK
ncbi:MAG: malate dehydrogenase [Gracilimonas sp.]|uniref:malate dehydrogenase n=1 Tax=Gracilimonas TaxID=649462 RepID=UPI001B1D405B|nr:malate dehydrogenase [Gracilimonas sp.]MBO6585072.1 malate dehydrogenase [Gracilimonas sp.]MBO6615657.1 malate dehydrogenase [Gracilimonas sp.]